MSPDNSPEATSDGSSSSSSSSEESTTLPSSSRQFNSSKKSRTSQDAASQADKSSADVQIESMTEQERPTSSIVHDHILPSGWTCNYEPQSGLYKFEYTGKHQSENAVDGNGRSVMEGLITSHETTSNMVQTSRRPTLHQFECNYGYHFPSSPTPSMISDLAKQVQKSSAAPATVKSKQTGRSRLVMLSDEEDKARRIKEMFPTATELVVEQMIRIYHGREGLIKAALISLGYKRSNDYNSQQATAQSPIMLMMSKPSSKKLFEKLISYFPDKDETLIKNLMYTHKEVEHEIISALVESGGSGADNDLHPDSERSRKGYLKRGRLDNNGAMMKLRYLKFLYPSCGEIELYHLLHCNDLNAQKVMEVLEEKGHKRANMEEVMEKRKSQTQQMRAQQASQSAKQKTPTVNLIEKHKNRTKPVVTESRANAMKDNLKKVFENHDDNLLLKALEAADYNEPLARKFLEEMEPIDEELYKQMYEIYHEPEPSVVLFPNKGVQVGDMNFHSVTCNDCVAIGKDVIECQTALALLKVDACTFTQDDLKVERLTQAMGKQPGLAKGSVFATLEVKDSLRRGPRTELIVGSKYKYMQADVGRDKLHGKAIGRNANLAVGANKSLNCGHNERLVQRIHPFFTDLPRGGLCGPKAN